MFWAGKLECTSSLSARAIVEVRMCTQTNSVIRTFVMERKCPDYGGSTIIYGLIDFVVLVILIVIILFLLKTINGYIQSLLYIMYTSSAKKNKSMPL